MNSVNFEDFIKGFGYDTDVFFAVVRIARSCVRLNMFKPTSQIYCKIHGRIYGMCSIFNLLVPELSVEPCFGLDGIVYGIDVAGSCFDVNVVANA